MNQPQVAVPDLGDHSLGTHKLPVGHYVSPEFYEREKEQIFRRCWLLAGRADDLAEPGDYFVFDVTPLEASVIVIRGKDGELRAFHNACTHRGARLLNNATGCARAITCDFHGWVFDPTVLAIEGVQIEVLDTGATVTALGGELCWQAAVDSRSKSEPRVS